MRQPAYYITHGGGPCFWMDFPPPLGPKAYESLRVFLDGLIGSLPARPKSVLVVSAHWEAPVPTVGSGEAPGMLYDYYGFPPHTYELSYPAPGNPALAARVQELLSRAGIASAADAERGFDHAVFVPMLIADPKAEIPVVTLSLQEDMDPEAHLAVGRALAPLRDEGVLILASGSSYHNLRDIFRGGEASSVEFDTWLRETAEAAPDLRTSRLIDWEAAPGARACHPREEHLIPLMVAVGAAEHEPGATVYHARIGGKPYSCFAFGAA